LKKLCPLFKKVIVLIEYSDNIEFSLQAACSSKYFKKVAFSKGKLSTNYLRKNSINFLLSVIVIKYPKV